MLPVAAGRESTGPPAVDHAEAHRASANAASGCYHFPMPILSRRRSWLATAVLFLLLAPAGARPAIAQTGAT